MSKTLIIDLDHTLLDAEKIKADLYKLVKRAGVSKKTAESHYINMFKTGFFTVENYSLLLVANRAQRKELEKKYKLLFKIPKKYNYPGAEGMLKKLHKKYSLKLLSYGDVDNQLGKIKQSRLGKYFKVITITQSKHKEEDLRRMKNSKKVLLIDNSKRVQRIAKLFNVPMIRVRKYNKNKKYFEELVERIESS